MKPVIFCVAFFLAFCSIEAYAADCMVTFQIDLYNAETEYENCNQQCNAYAGAGFPNPQYCYYECDAAFSVSVSTAANNYALCCCFSGGCTGVPCG